MQLCSSSGITAIQFVDSDDVDMVCNVAGVMPITNWGEFLSSESDGKILSLYGHSMMLCSS